MASRRRMTKHLSLVLLSSLSGVSGCGCNGQPQEKMEEVEEWVADPPPEGVEHVVGAPFLLWWEGEHPPTLVKRLVPATVASSTTRSTYSRPYYSRPYYGGRSSFLGSSFSGSSSGSHSSTISRGGFGSSGHASSGSSS